MENKDEKEYRTTPYWAAQAATLAPGLGHDFGYGSRSSELPGEA